MCQSFDGYRKQAWWKDSGFVAKPLDVIIDCAEGLPAWQHAIGSGVLKSGAKGGRFLALTMANPNQHFKKWWQMVSARLVHAGRCRQVSLPMLEPSLASV